MKRSVGPFPAEAILEHRLSINHATLSQPCLRTDMYRQLQNPCRMRHQTFLHCPCIADLTSLSLLTGRIRQLVVK